MGVFVFALLLGQIRDIVSNASRNREDYRRQMDMALSECKRLNLSRELTDRVRDWFDYTWAQQKTLGLLWASQYQSVPVKTRRS